MAVGFVAGRGRGLWFSGELAWRRSIVLREVLRAGWGSQSEGPTHTPILLPIFAYSELPLPMAIEQDRPPLETGMQHTISLQIPTPTFLELAEYLREYGDERDPSEIATLAIATWLALAKGEVRYAPRERGYQWKGLFLPDQTEIRMLHGGIYTYANIVDDAVGL